MELRLLEIYKELLEQLPPLPPSQFGGPGQMSPKANFGAVAGNAPPPQPKQSSSNVVELADINTVVSVFPEQKKIVFSSQDHTAYTKRLKLYVDVLKQNFMIDNINLLGEGIFEIVFDPREKFESVIQFLQPQINGNG